MDSSAFDIKTSSGSSLDVSTSTPVQTATSPLRWYILTVFTTYSCIQATIWLGFTSVATNAEEYFHVGNASITLLLNWGPICFIPFSLVAAWIMEQENGFQRIVRFGVSLLFAGTLIAVVPLIIPLPSSVIFKPIVFQHLCAIINAAAGPMVMAPPTLLSAIWFAPSERTTSTAVATVANQLGVAVGFALAFLVNKPHEVPRLIYIHVAITALLFCAVWVYFPSYPRVPPSASAPHPLHRNSAEKRKTPGGSLDASTTDTEQSFYRKQALTLIHNFGKILLTPTFLTIVLIPALIQGVFNGWSGMFDVILKPMGIGQSEASWFGVTSILAGVIGGVLGGIVSDILFQRRLKVILFLLLGLSFLTFQWFTWSLPSFMNSRHSLLPSSEATLIISVSLASLFLNATIPIFFELAVELTHPIPTATSTMLITLISNIISLITIFAADFVSRLYVNEVMALTALLSAIALLFVRERYSRTVKDLAGDLFVEANIQNEKSPLL